MSLETWKAEFYSTPAHEVPVEDAIQHSLRKWRGLTKENLEKHELHKEGSAIGGRGGFFPIYAVSCALCTYYIDNVDCFGCPLAEVLGYRCDDSDGDETSPYHEFTRNGNPLPMIEALERAAALEPDIR